MAARDTGSIEQGILGQYIQHHTKHRGVGGGGEGRGMIHVQSGITGRGSSGSLARAA